MQNLRKKEAPLKSLDYGLPLFWCGFVFVLFSLSKNKQEYYIAPIYPVAAVILAGVFERITRRTVRGHLEAGHCGRRSRQDAVRSDEAAFCTGQVISPNGGEYIY